MGINRQKLSTQIQLMRCGIAGLLALCARPAYAVTDEALNARLERAADTATITAPAPSPTRPPRSGQRAYREIREACWPTAALSGLHCERARLREQGQLIQERYHRSAVQRWLSDPSANLSSSVTHGIGSAGRELGTFLSSGPSCRQVSTTAQVCQIPVTEMSEYELFVDLLAQRMRELEPQVPAAARECFRPCLVKCAVSNLLNYAEREEQNFGSFLRSRYLDGAPQIFSSAQGECAEIALLATDLGRRLGLSSMRNVATMEHEFNAVEVGGRTLTFDAASPSCLFFEDY